MFGGEPELRAKRKAISLLTDEVRKVTEATRALSISFEKFFEKDINGMKEALSTIENIKEEVQAYRRSLARELINLGGMVLNREDFLRSAYNAEGVMDYIHATAFRLLYVDPNILLDSWITENVKEMVSLTFDMVQKLNDMIRAITLNPTKVIEVGTEIEKLEAEVDVRYRRLSFELAERINDVHMLILILEVIDRVENVADSCLETADSFTILSLSM